MKRYLLLISLLISHVLFANPIHNIVVFGDSLSDNGNFYKFMGEQSPPKDYYFEGRFSNGRVWVEYLGDHYFGSEAPKHVENYAMGLAAVSSDTTQESPLFTLDGQVKTYIEAHTNSNAIEESLFIFWMGSNNYLGYPEDPEHTLTPEVIAGIGKNIQYLVQQGAKNILVMNLPDIGKTPYARMEDYKCPEDDKTCASFALDAFSKEHNNLLYKSIFDSQQGLKSKYPQVNWLFFNINRMFSDVIQNPSHYGITNETDNCLKPGMVYNKRPQSGLIISNTQLKSIPNCDGYLFYDFLHPTTFAHQVIANKVIQSFEDAGVDISLSR